MATTSMRVMPACTTPASVGRIASVRSSASAAYQQLSQSAKTKSNSKQLAVPESSAGTPDGNAPQVVTCTSCSALPAPIDGESLAVRNYVFDRTNDPKEDHFSNPEAAPR